jgi:hypothetical protein
LATLVAATELSSFASRNAEMAANLSKGPVLVVLLVMRMRRRGRD